jgi:hypothetical protein
MSPIIEAATGPRGGAGFGLLFRTLIRGLPMSNGRDEARGAGRFMSWRGGLIVVVAAVVLPAAVALAGRPGLGGLCPDGTIEETNAGFSFEDVGCSVCRPDESCQAFCITVPVQLCPAGPSVENIECCRANPCNGNCPEPDDPLLCSVRSCVCDPGGCCTLACPVQTMAPVADSNGLVVLTVLLAATGVLYLGRRVRHRG